MITEDPLTPLALLNENRFFKKAIYEILNHPYYDDVAATHCSIIVKGGKIVSIAVNKHLRNSFVDFYRHHDGCNLHSECRAILKARKKIDLRGAKMYVARLRKKDKLPGMSKPCPMCTQVLKNYGFKKVYYTTEQGFEVINCSEF